MLSNPGPGSYETLKTSSASGLLNSDSYIQYDNGERTKRTQPMAMSKKILTTAFLNREVQQSPGPGQYEAIASEFNSPMKN